MPPVLSNGANQGDVLQAEMGQRCFDFSLQRLAGEDLDGVIEGGVDTIVPKTAVGNQFKAIALHSFSSFFTFMSFLQNG